MKLKIYHLLVNRHPGISERYHGFHDGTGGTKKLLSWLYLLWLNFCYYILFCRFLGKYLPAKPYEEKRLLLNQSESQTAARQHPDIEALQRQLMDYDIISFDLFDTLILRPFSQPTDLFFLLGEELGILDFKNLRVRMEAEAREACRKKYGHTEVTLKEIWSRIEQEIGISAQKGMERELALEKKLCYANPFMLPLYQQLIQSHKKIIIISDMYLPQEFLKALLEENGFTGMEEIFVSCEYRKSKAEGSLFTLVKDKITGKANAARQDGTESPIKIIHVGDNPVSDVRLAQRHGLAACYYPNVNRNTLLYRPYDMSPVIGGAYRGVINNALYNGQKTYSMEYEYGFIYGGLFVVGYCSFIRDYCKKNEIDKILFLSRDGDILKQVYDILFPGEKTEYAYWSRAAATKLMAAHNKYDYCRRYLSHKVNQGYTIAQILTPMELSELAKGLPMELSGDTLLTDKNIDSLKDWINEHWNEILKCYDSQQEAGKIYYTRLLADSGKACAVDVGWAGSGAVSLDYLVRHVWKLPCQIIGLVAGTNTIHNAEPEASEILLQSGRLVPYLYSQAMNRDLLKKHDLNRGYNIFWELLLSSPTKQFKGFAIEPGTENIELRFGKDEANRQGIRQIQQGIRDFAKEYSRHFKDFPYMLRISGRDAYSPMLVAASYKEEYLKVIAGKFDIKVNVEE